MSRWILSTLFIAAVLVGSVPAWAGELDPELEAQLGTLEPWEMMSVIIEMTDQLDPATATSPRWSKELRIQEVMKALQGQATRSQRWIRKYLVREWDRGGVQQMIPLWIFNGLALTATEPVIRHVAAWPEVRKVRPDRRIPRPSPAPAAAGPASGISEWNITQIRAPEVWELDPTYTGVGTVVGSFDTGVDLNHPDLASRYRGNHAISWFDPYGEHSSPYDFDGHGTHTTGIAVGGDAGGTNIGVAPGAQWIAAKAWNDAGLGFTSAFHEIFQWFLAPGGDPANAPDVVNASWAFSTDGCLTEFLPDVQALRAAGIFPTFASGNNGPLAGSVLSPGAYADSFAVGATDLADNIASFSARGPSPCDGGVKPDMSAPGVGVLSSVPGGYVAFSGTSMAAPHVAGAVAVLRSINPGLTVDELESALAEGAVDRGPPGPDDSFGAGRLDLFQSAQIVSGGAGRPIITITATDASAAEAPLDPGALTVSRTGSTEAALTLLYTVSGTATPGSDYGALPGSITIPAGSATAAIAVTPIDDSLVETDETVVVALSADAAYIVGTPGSASVTIVSDEVPADLVIGTFSTPFSVGAGTPISVTETTRNQGAGPAGASTTKFHLSTNNILDAGDTFLGSRAVPALAAGASDSSSTTLTIPTGTAAGAYYLIVQADGDDAVVESLETNNTNPRYIQVGPDLMIYSLSVPSTVEVGTAISVTDTTKNQGGGAGGASTTQFYLSSNPTLDAGDTFLGSRAVPALAAGATDSGSTSVTIPAGTSTGTYYLIAQADGPNAILESQESNNTNARFLQIGPDLIISSLSSPSTVAPGTAISVTETTKNQGGGAGGASTTHFYLSSNVTLDAGDTFLGSRAVPALAAGASDTGATALTIPAATATGTYYLIAQADGPSAILETQESNNTTARFLQVGSDLVIASFSAPFAAGAGETISVTETTKNQGGGSVGASTTNFYLSTNSVLDGGDTFLGSRPVAALAAGASDTGSTALTIPAATATGSYYLIAQADGENVIVETQESNNTNARFFQVGSDLVIASFSTPFAVGAGETISVTETTKNQGGGATGASTTNFYLSANSLVDAGDTLIGSRAVPALAAGVSNTGSTALTIPAGTPTGSYYLIAQADGDNAVLETQESNNANARFVQLGPDLMIYSLSVPSPVGPGATISVTDTSKNQGGESAAASTTRLYLSTNSLLDAGDTPLGSRSVPALAAGATHSGSTSVTIPAGTATGNYYVIAEADGDNAIAETQESNNINARFVQVTQVGSDLVISSFSAPLATGMGGTISVTETTRNQGDGAAAASTTRFYLSTNSILDAADTPLGSRAVPTLGAGFSNTGSTSLTIPAGTATGSYYVIAEADGDNAVAETEEGNNTSARSIQIGPDLVISYLWVGTGVGTISVTDTTKNQGGESAGASTTKFYLSSNTILDAGDVLLGSRTVPALAAGGAQTGWTTLTIPAGTAGGTHYVIAEADGDNAVSETQEGNNSNARSFQIGPDLLIAGFWTPYAVGAGATISVTDTTKNQGGGAAGASTTKFFLSTNSLLDAGDTLVGSRAVPALAAGASSWGSTSVTIPAGIAAGGYYLIAHVDGDNVVPETRETNNTNARYIQVGPDLMIYSFSIPFTAQAGATISVTDTTKNQGGESAGTTTTNFYLSTNYLLDAGDTLLGSRAVPALAAGATHSGSTTLTIPEGVAAGYYYLIAQADADNAVVETQEGNNVNARFIQISSGP